MNNLLEQNMNNYQNSFKDIIYTPKRICIMPCNSLLGSSLVDCIRNDHENENPHVITGILDQNEDCQDPPYGLNVLITDHNKDNLLVAFADADIVILELLKIDFNLLEFLLWKLEEGYIDSQTTILIVSSPLLWSENASSISSTNRQIVSPRVDNQNTISENDNFNGSIFGESDFAKRKCLPCFELLRLWENKFLQLDNKILNIRPIVLVPGIVYGRGEDDFYSLFQQLLGLQDVIKIYGKGNNLIPLCHVSDLISCIKVSKIWLLIIRMSYWKKMETKIYFSA
jgi:hypothetical protein